MRAVPQLRSLNPLRLFHHAFSYQSLSTSSQPDLQNFRGYSRAGPSDRRRWCGRMSMTKLIGMAIAAILLLAVVGGGGYRQVSRKQPVVEEERKPSLYFWQLYDRLDGYYNGVRTLVPYAKYEAENRYNQSELPPKLSHADMSKLSHEPPLDPVPYNPYPDSSSEAAGSAASHLPIDQCYLDIAEKTAAPDVYAYPGLPQHMSEPFFGSYAELGLPEDICFERFGRLGPYGYGYNESHDGLGPGTHSESSGSEKVFKQSGFINYTGMDWGSAQERCREKNYARYETSQPRGKERVQRQAYVLRTWTGYFYNDHQIYSLRALVNELSLKAGGEYDVHLLLHVKNNSIPIWADKQVYQDTLEANVPREFWNITTLWSEQQMVAYYPEPFPDNFANMAGSGIHGVYRSAHFALQWFSQQHPEYDHVWNWEMDVRNSGHHYDFHSKVGAWAKKQPRKGLWERSSRFWIPALHGSYQNFTEMVEREIVEHDIPNNDVSKSGPMPIWGPVQGFPNRGMLAPPNGTTPPTTYDEDNYEWGVGEEADLIVFNPLFDPSLTNWVFTWDVTGYARDLTIPPRRAAIITVARLSKRLLNIMHEETWRMKHTMFPEMWPPAVSMHHGLKAVYAPHPVYFDRDWEVEKMDQVFNHPQHEHESPFGWGEHNLLGSSFYYNSGFSGALWRRWLGQWENGEGGRAQEEAGTGRLCLRGTLHHPIKHELGPLD